jgi:aminoglycoside 3'-phosphotransferase II
LRATPILVGESGATVFATGHGTIVKVDHADAPNTLQREAEVLRYAVGRFPAPALISCDSISGWQVLEMTRVPGEDASTERMLTRPAELCARLAHSLRMLHALPVADCPFDRRTAALLAEAGQRLSRGQVDTDDFDEPVDPVALLDTLRRTQPAADDLVVAHGDYCFPNIMLDPDSLALTGLIDLGRLGVADRFLDLGIAARSIGRNLGPGWVTPFFEAYGLPPDPVRIRYFQQIDEFF